MEIYKYKNAIVRVHGEVDKERLKNATIQFFTKARKYKAKKETRHGNANSPRDKQKE